MNEHVITIRHGVVRMLYTDTIDLKKIGEPHIMRAADVEYDNKRRGWTVAFWFNVFGPLPRVAEYLQDPPGSNKRAVFSTRQAAIDAEVAYLQRHAL